MSGCYIVAIIGFSTLALFNLSSTMILIMTFISRFAVAGCFNILYTYTMKLYPTTVRAQGFGINSAFARVGSITFPMLIELLSQYVTIVFIAMNVGCFCLMMFLPETMNKPLATEIPEVLQKEKENLL